MLSDDITACIFAFNEEIRIQRCINNFQGYFKIIVVDNFSTDRTKQIVQLAGHRCISIKNPGFQETPEVMNRVMDAVDTDYVLMCSVSEYIPLALMKKYAEVANSKSHDVVCAFRESITAGHPIPISGRPGVGNHGENRFFRKGAVDYTGNKVHGRGRIVCPDTRVLSVIHDEKLYFYQFRDYDCSHTELTLCRYDDLLAKQRHEAGQRFSLIRAICMSVKHFLSSYFYYGSFRFGMLGFLHCYYRAHMEFTIWLRIWELESGYTRAEVISKNGALRELLEKDDLPPEN